MLECFARALLTASSSERAEVGGLWRKYAITVVGTAMAANLLLLLTTSLGNQSSYLLSGIAAELLGWQEPRNVPSFLSG